MVILGVEFVVVGMDLFQTGSSQVFRLEAFRHDSASNHLLGQDNGTQTSQLLPLHHHSSEHLQRPRSSIEISLSAELARAIAIQRASRTSR